MHVHMCIHFGQTNSPATRIVNVTMPPRAARYLQQHQYGPGPRYPEIFSQALFVVGRDRHVVGAAQAKINGTRRQYDFCK